MPRVSPTAIVSGPMPEGSVVVATRVADAQVVASQRMRRTLTAVPNGRLTGSGLRAACGMDAATQRRATSLADEERASGRGTERLLRVARTIADLAGDNVVRSSHLDEAAWYRQKRSAGLAAVAG